MDRVTSTALPAIVRAFEIAGWDLRVVDVDLVAGRLVVEIHRFDGRWLYLAARADIAGQATPEQSADLFADPVGHRAVLVAIGGRINATISLLNPRVKAINAAHSGQAQVDAMRRRALETAPRPSSDVEIVRRHGPRP